MNIDKLLPKYKNQDIIEDMRNHQKGFFVPLLIIIAVLVVGVIIGYLILKYKTELNNENYISYSNNAFTVNYPKGWTVDEFTVSRAVHACNSLGTYFVSIPVLKKTLVTDDGSDYLHYLKNSGSVISITGGIGGDRVPTMT